MLKRGANPNARTDYGSTPIMVARDGATVDVLVEFGADLTVKTKEGEGLIVTSGNMQDATRLEALLRHNVPFDPKTDGPTILMRAAWSNQTDVMAALLAHGVDPNAKGLWNKEANDYMTPLQAAVTDGQYDAAKLLIEHGAKIQDRSLSTVKTPHFNEMTSALQNRRKNIVKLFWDHGDRGVSELSYAISQGQSLGEIKKLLDGGIPADPPQDAGFRPITQAAELGRLDIVKLLLERGAKIAGSDDKEGVFSTLNQAAWVGQDEIVTYLLQHGAKAGYQPLWNAVWNSHPYENQRTADHFEKTVKILLDAGAAKNLSSEQSVNMLLGAIFSPATPLETRRSSKCCSMRASAWRRRTTRGLRSSAWRAKPARLRPAPHPPRK